MAQPLGLTAGALDVGAMALHRPFALAPLCPQVAKFGGITLDAAVSIEQAAMGRRFDEGALVMLPMDFHECRTERSQHLDADRLIVDKGAGAAVGILHAAQNEFVLAAQTVIGKKPAGRMIRSDVESGNHLTLIDALAHQSGVAARAERKRKSVEQN